MKALKLLTIAALFSTSGAYAATITVKATSNIEWSGEGAYLSSNKGDLSIYTVGITPKQYQSLKSIKKGQCLLITANDQSLAKQNGTISIMEFQSAKKITCK